MADVNALSPWRKKFLSTRMAFESILFEKELLQPQKEKLSTGLLVLAGIWLFYALLLAQWALRRGNFFSQADAESFGAVLHYAGYLRSQGFWALVKPEFSGQALNPPLYYLAFVPVLDYVTSNLNSALVLVNSFFLLVLALSVFLAVRRSRPNRAGWLGAAFALSMPCVLELARRPSPELALLAFTAALYACYINSDEFEHPKWAFAFAVTMSLGFYAHRSFWLYVLPLVPFIMTGFASPYSRDELFKGFFPGLVINLPWYLFLASAVGVGFAPFRGPYTGFWHYLGLARDAAGLPLFLLGAAGLAWMYFSVFMPYEKKKIVAAWFWAPYLLLTWVVRGSRPELLYPALLPFAVALPVMTPHQARKYLLVFVLALGAVNQSGLVPPVTLGGQPLAGLPRPPASGYREPELLSLVRTGVPASGGLVAVYGGDSVLNAETLRFAAGPGNIKFSDAPACPACAGLLLHKTPRPGETPSAGEAAFTAVKSSDWFPAQFTLASQLELPGASRVEVYHKTPGGTEYFEEGTIAVRGLSFGLLKIEDATLKLSGFDKATGKYASAELFAPVAQVLGGDIYGLTLEIKGLSAAGPGKAPFVPSGVDSVKVVSAKISAYAVERYLAGRFPFLSGLQVKLADDGLALSAVTRGQDLDAKFALSLIDGGVLEVRPVAFSLGMLGLPDYFLKLFTFRFDFSQNPYGIRLAGLRINRQMIELY